MSTISEAKSITQKSKYFGPATVLDVNEDKGLLLIKIDSIENNFKTWGRLAFPYPHAITHGDLVLAAGEDINAIYVIGLLDRKPLDQCIENKLTLSNGAYASVNKTQEAEKFQLCSKSGEMIFEYEPETGKSSIYSHSVDLEIAAKKGDINFISEQNIYFKSKQSIEMESQYGIHMTTKNVIDQDTSSISIRPMKMNLSSPKFGITAQRSAIQIEESKFIGNTFSATFKRGKLIIGRLESMANDIICKAKNVYRTVDELTQLKAGRMRTIVNSTLHMKAKKSYLKAEDDFKINAKKIHLG